MTRRSGHRPEQRLVPRKPRGPMPDTDLWAHLPEPDAATHSQPPARDSLDERFEAWITRNPQVLENFVRLAREAKDAGRDRIGAKMLAEVLRWRSYIDGDEGGYKLNNVFVSRLVRLAVDRNPDLDGLFETRKLHRAS